MAFGNRPGQVRFSDITESSGILRQGQTWGLSIFDFNQDHLADIYQNNHQQKPVSLFLNQGNDIFIDVTLQFFPRRFPGDFHGAVGFDVDNDGDLDLFQGGGGDLRASDDNPNKSNRFLIQENGQLLEQAEELGVRFPLGRARQPNVFDFNDDGRLDILFTGPRRPDFKSFATIFLQEEQGFKNLGLETGLDTVTTNGTFGIFADLTGDSRHELIYVAKDPIVQIYDTSELPLREMSEEILPPDLLKGVNVIKDIAVADFNGDAYQDLLIVQQGTGASGFRLDRPNSGRAHLEYSGETLGLTFKNAGKLFLNFEGDSSLKLPTFIRNEVVVRPENIFIGERKINPKSLDFRLNPEKASSQGMPDFQPGVDYGVFIGFDVQRKQWEIKVSARRDTDFNFLFETERLKTDVSPFGFNLNFNGKPDRLLLYNPTLGRFVDSTPSSGLDTVDVASRSVIAEDFDNDGDQDVFIVATANTQNLPDVLYENLGDAKFRQIPRAAGAAGILEGIGDSAVSGDFNADGFVDIIVNNGDALGPDRNFWLDGTNRLFRNEGNDNHWIQIDLEGVESNRDAVGATVYITTPDGKRQVRSQNSGIHNRTQNFPRLHFGIGQQPIISKIEVIWPDGELQVFRDVTPNRVILLKENNPVITTLFGETPDTQSIVGTVGDDRLIGTAANDVIQGLAGRDRLRGSRGDDTLVGGVGNDILTGNQGQDLLNGGPGQDRYVWSSPKHGGDRVVSFVSVADDIFVSRKGFDIDLPKGRLPASRFVLGSKATKGSDRFIYDRTSGHLFFDPDGNRGKSSTLLATFEDAPVIKASDIFLQ